MKNFEFPGQVEFQPKARDLQQKQTKPVFGAFGTNSKSKVASVSKQEQLLKEQKLKQYRDMVGMRGQQETAQNLDLEINSQNPAVSQTPVLTNTYQPRKLQANTNNFMIDQAIKKSQAPSQALMSVNISKKADYLQDENDDLSNNKGIQASYQRPQTAKPQPKGEAIAVKQMIFLDDKNTDIEGQVREALRNDVKNVNNPRQKKLQNDAKSLHSQTSQINKHQNRLQDAKQKQQSTYYKSQYCYEDDYEEAKQSKSDKKLEIAGAEMRIEQIDQSKFNKINQHQKDGDGAIGSFNLMGGQQAKAMPATIKTSNANRFYKGYQKKLAEHKQEKVEHFESIYGQPTTEENKKQVKKARPQTAKSALRSVKKPSYMPSSRASQGGGLGAISHISLRDFGRGDQDKELQRQRSIKNLESMYGKSEKIEQYYNDKEMLEKRDETKKELKMLLKKYMSDAEHNNICALRVGHAQKEVHELHNRMDKAVKKIEGCEDQFERTKREVLDMNDYLQKDRFIADDFKRNIERNIKNARIAWTADSQSVNERIRSYEELFEDPSRLPQYDEKSKVWNLSSKFNLEENDQADDDAAIFHHPFLNKVI
eukprot:403338226